MLRNALNRVALSLVLILGLLPAPGPDGLTSAAESHRVFDQSSTSARLRALHDYGGVSLLQADTRPQSGSPTRTGTFAIQPQFDDAWWFEGGLAPVKRGTTWGFVDRTGKVVIATRFLQVNKFSDGLATVQIADAGPARWAVVNATGDLVFGQQYLLANPFFEGLAAVLVGNGPSGSWGYIDKTGKIVVKPQFPDTLRPFGLLHPTFGFFNGLAAVRVGAGDAAKWGYIDKTGKMVIAPQFYDSEAFSSDGLAEVQLAPGGKWGFADKTGKIIIPPQFDATSSFSEGLAAIRLGDEDGDVPVAVEN